MSESGNHFQETMGYMPPSIADLVKYAPEVADAYTEMRTRMVGSSAEEPGRLPDKYRHIVLAALDSVLRNVNGAEKQAASAIRCGATFEEVRDGVMLVILTNGMPAWGQAGRHAVRAAAIAAGLENESDESN